MRIETAEHAQFNDGACIWQILRLREIFRDGELRSDPFSSKNMYIYDNYFGDIQRYWGLNSMQDSNANTWSIPQASLKIQKVCM